MGMVRPAGFLQEANTARPRGRVSWQDGGKVSWQDVRFREVPRMRERRGWMEGTSAPRWH